ncbi:MAG: sensor histidine kinase, partial [Myxococcaceae bacterium]
MPAVSAERASVAELRDQIAAVSGSPIVTALLDAVDTLLLVLNPQRQILAANLRQGLAPRDIPLDSVLGQRTGEALGCIYAREHPDGCGAAEACRTCGALRAAESCRDSGRPVEGECLLTVDEKHGQSSHEFAVRATPVEVSSQVVTVLSLRDISAEKRRDALEHVFFHDLLNTLAGLAGWSERLRRAGEGDWRAPAQRVALLVSRLETEIRNQRSLVLAETGALTLELNRVTVGTICHGLRELFASHSLARRRKIDIHEPDANLELRTDVALVLRVATNMVTNALEATPPGGTVRLWCTQLEGALGPRLAMFVHNDAVIPPLVAARMFQRSFSTKTGSGRGLGTYSMKLLGERYLGGKVSFMSKPGRGTTFVFELP